jgi:alpha(1,3/1,4) fucosyltransferase
LTFLFANFRAGGTTNNAWFTQGHRDNCNYPFWLLREKFKDHGIHLNTPDVNGNEDIAFELHIDAQESKTCAPCYLFLWETSQVNPKNNSLEIINRYRRVFSWDDSLVEAYKYTKFYLFNVNDKAPFIVGWSGRDRMCCAITGNKSVDIKDSRELYSKRVETFKWFECHAPNDFDLFGTGWDSPASRPGLFGKLRSKALTRLYKWTNIHPFPSYRGTVASKRATLERYKFSICYENMSDLPGYITEKIFDCFFAGCVPVYWGASNIYDYIPQTCFVDRRKFVDHESLYHFLLTMPEKNYIAYQNAIKIFLKSQAATLFYPEPFVSNIVDTIVTDFEKLS